MNIIVTGGYGFIGFNFVQYLMNKNIDNLKIIVVDKITYACTPYLGDKIIYFKKLSKLIDILESFQLKIFLWEKHSFHEYLQTYYMPGTVLGSGDVSESKKHQSSWLHRIDILMGWHINFTQIHMYMFVCDMVVMLLRKTKKEIQ